MTVQKPNRFAFTSLRFPQELGTDQVPAYIRFTPQTVQYGGTTALGRPPGGGFGSALPVTGRVGNPIQQLENQIGGVVQTLSQASDEIFGSVNNIFQSTSLTQAFSNFGRVINGRVRIGDFTLNFGQQTLPDQLRSEGSISLFLPEQLQTQNAVDYDAAEIGAAGLAQVQATREAAAEDTVDVGKLFEGVLAGGVGQAINAGPLKAINAIATGRIVNPYSYQIFNGVQHRNFSYSFKMVPKNAAEAEEIKNICDMFLFYMLPSRSVEAGLHFYDIPVQWKVEYFKQSNRLEHYQQPNACFLQSVNVTYGGEGKNALHNDGAPMDTTVELSFVEIEPLYREKIEDGFQRTGTNTPTNTGPR